MKYKELEEKILNRADDKDLLVEGNLLLQSSEISIKAYNLHNAVFAKSKGFKEFIIEGNKIRKTSEEIKKNLGEIFYDLIIIAEINEVSLEDCLEEIYKNIK